MLCFGLYVLFTFCWIFPISAKTGKTKGWSLCPSHLVNKCLAAILGVKITEKIQQGCLSESDRLVLCKASKESKSIGKWNIILKGKTLCLCTFFSIFYYKWSQRNCSFACHGRKKVWIHKQMHFFVCLTCNKMHSRHILSDAFLEFHQNIS